MLQLTLIVHRTKQSEPASCVFSLVEVFSGHSHVIGCLQGQDTLEELQSQRHVGVHVFYGVESRADAVRHRLVEVGRGFIPLLWRQKNTSRNIRKSQRLIVFISICCLLCILWCFTF